MELVHFHFILSTLHIYLLLSFLLFLVFSNNKKNCNILQFFHHIFSTPLGAYLFDVTCYFTNATKKKQKTTNNKFCLPCALVKARGKFITMLHKKRRKLKGCKCRVGPVFITYEHTKLTLFTDRLLYIPRRTRILAYEHTKLTLFAERCHD